MDLAKSARAPLSHAPTQHFTLKRSESKMIENMKLLTHFAEWLSKASGRPVHMDTFENDLMDGIVLCTVVSKLEGSNLYKFHQISTEDSLSAPLTLFKAKENMTSFQVACEDNLKLPCCFGWEELEKGNLARIASTLVFLAHTAKTQNVFVEEMDEAILNKVKEMDQALDSAANGPGDGQEAELSWWQSLLARLGLAEWLNAFSLDSLKAYIQTLRENVTTKVQTQKEMILNTSWTDALPESIKTRISTT